MNRQRLVASSPGGARRCSRRPLRTSPPTTTRRPDMAQAVPIDPEKLLEHAPSPGEPPGWCRPATSTDLAERAVSSAYYSAFHAVSLATTLQLAPLSSNDDRHRLVAHRPRSAGRGVRLGGASRRRERASNTCNPSSRTFKRTRRSKSSPRTSPSSRRLATKPTTTTSTSWERPPRHTRCAGQPGAGPAGPAPDPSRPAELPRSHRTALPAAMTAPTDRIQHFLLVFDHARGKLIETRSAARTPTSGGRLRGYRGGVRRSQASRGRAPRFGLLGDREGHSRQLLRQPQDLEVPRRHAERHRLQLDAEIPIGLRFHGVTGRRST